MVIATSVPSAVFTALGVWAAVMAIQGGVSGFVLLAAGRPVDEVLQEAQLGAIAGVPAGFLFAVASVFLV